MSSPIAKPEKSAADRALIALHKRLSHGRRIQLLATAIAALLRDVGLMQSRVRLLDVGCGDMGLADAIVSLCPEVEVRCVDVHPVGAALAKADTRWSRYSQFDGRNLQFSDAEFDLVLFADVLHHVNADCLLPLLRSASRVGKLVIIKDHLEYGWWSRQSLRAMDWIGNFGYGVSVPRRYFTEESLVALLRNCGLCVRELRVGLDLYRHLPLGSKLLPARWQFIALAGPATAPTRDS